MFEYNDKVTKVDFNDNQAVDKAIRAVTTGYAKYKPMLHAALVGCALHAVKHNDASKLTSLYNGLGDEINKKNGIMKWIEKFTSLQYKKNKAGVFMFIGKTVNKKNEYAFVIEGEAIPFYDMPEVKKANKPFDLLEAFKHLVERAEKKEDLPIAQADFLARLKALVPVITLNDEIPFEA